MCIRDSCLNDTYVYSNLKDYCRQNETGKLFYSESYMREKAHGLGMEMHDFRRAYAKDVYKRQRVGDIPGGSPAI